MARQRSPNLRLVERTQFYRFKDVGGVDPDLSYICEVILKSGLSPSEIVDDIEEMTNGAVRISYLTIFRWLEGKTKRPHNHSLIWVGRALGLERQWIKKE